MRKEGEAEKVTMRLYLIGKYLRRERTANGLQNKGLIVLARRLLRFAVQVGLATVASNRGLANRFGLKTLLTKFAHGASRSSKRNEYVIRRVCRYASLRW